MTLLMALVGLTAGAQTYNQRFDTNGDGKVSVADVTYLVDYLLGKVTPTQHEYVDLGLPSGTLWATMNIGAPKPEHCGDFFAWGETSGYNGGKTTFNWTTYKYCMGTNKTLTKYCDNSEYGTVDHLTELDLEDDAAYVNWGPGWRMPSKEQFNELRNSELTTAEWTTVNGVNGQKITSKANGNSIFLPAAGVRRGASLSKEGSEGYYWSRTLETGPLDYARYLNFDSSDIYNIPNERCFGRSVRPVRNK